MEIVSLITSAVVGISAGLLISKLKKLLANKKHTRMTVKLPRGESYEIDLSENNQKEKENIIRSFVYSTDPKPTFNPTVINTVEDIINPTLEALESKCKEKDIRIETMGFDKVPHIYADVYAIRQVIFNLLENAIKYSPEKSTIELQAYASRDFIELRFINPVAKSLNAQEIENIFKQGFRGEESARKEQSGQGLGLYVVKLLTTEHNGRVSIKQKDGLIVTSVELPLSETDIDAGGNTHSPGSSTEQA